MEKTSETLITGDSTFDDIIDSIIKQAFIPPSERTPLKQVGHKDKDGVWSLKNFISDGIEYANNEDVPIVIPQDRQPIVIALPMPEVDDGVMR